MGFPTMAPVLLICFRRSPILKDGHMVNAGVMADGRPIFFLCVVLGEVERTMTEERR